MAIVQNMLLLNVPFLVFVLCFLALLMSLFRLEKMFDVHTNFLVKIR